MSPYLRAALIIIACVCFGVALTYPILYAVQTEDSSSGMDSLAAMRQQALDTNTQEPDNPVPAVTVLGEDGETDAEFQEEELASETEPTENMEDETAQERIDGIDSQEIDESDITESSIQNRDQSRQDASEEFLDDGTDNAEVTEVSVNTSPEPNLSSAQVDETSDREASTVPIEDTVEESDRNAAENLEMIQTPAEVEEASSSESVPDETSDDKSATSSLSWTGSQNNEEEGWIVTSRRTVEQELAEMLDIITDDGQIVSALEGLNSGAAVSGDVENDEDVNYRTNSGDYLNLSEIERELSEDLMILTEEGELIPAASYDPDAAKRKRQEKENALIAEMMVMTEDGRFLLASESMVRTPTPRPVIRITPSPVPTTTPDRRVRTDTVVPYPNKEKVLLDESKILDELKEIYEINHDLVGWLNVPGTYIDYPVVQSAEKEADFYLKHDFYGKYNKNGQLILDPKCDPYTPSYNLIISGHHMLNGNMFGYLSRFYKKEYWEKRKILKFDNLMEHKEYIIFATFYSADYDIDEEGFRYNADIRFRKECEAWLAEIRENQLYDTGIDAEFGDEFITLTTCAANRKNGRFVAVARRIREGERFE